MRNNMELSELNKLVAQIREKCGTPYMMTKKALVAANRDVDKAIELLREKGLAGDHPVNRRMWWEE